MQIMQSSRTSWCEDEHSSFVYAKSRISVSTRRLPILTFSWLSSVLLTNFTTITQNKLRLLPPHPYQLITQSLMIHKPTQLDNHT
jgi:hypothetical protein